MLAAGSSHGFHLDNHTVITATIASPAISPKRQPIGTQGLATNTQGVKKEKRKFLTDAQRQSVVDMHSTPYRLDRC